MALRKTWVVKFWPDLEISEAFVMGLEVSFSGDFVSWSLEVGTPGLAVSQSRIYHSIPLIVMCELENGKK